MGTAKLVTFFDLLSDGYTVAQLATAVETYGATGWDRFERFGSFPPNSDGARQALDSLASYLDHANKWLRDQSEVTWDDREGVVAGSPLDGLDDCQELGIHRFGWYEEHLPRIDRSVEHPPLPKPISKPAQPRETAMLNILGSILLYMEDMRNREKAFFMPSQSQLIDRLCTNNVGVDGISKSNLEKWFARARQSTQGARVNS